ncbi:nucleoporin GLE1-like isoform X2 [Anneissia japonica]|uniref:nucleoporin GLE1-like isoform X2 n=1 Tax=Anneissia japonica TaxID=1529436 RepID=UPI0014255910|nr:nucleoporin GLE1-like isoform X2 [Anneissia japonica]
MAVAGVLEGLKSTSLGKVKYDPYWLEENRLPEILQESTSPPTLKNVTAQFNIFRTENVEKEQHQNINQNNSRVDDDRQDDISISICSDEADHVSEIKNIAFQPANHVEQSLQSFEDKWQQKAEENIKKRRESQEQYSNHLWDQSVKQVAVLEQHQKIKTMQLMKRVKKIEEESNETIRKRLLHQRESHQRNIKRLDAKLKEVEEMTEAEAVERRRAELEAERKAKAAEAKKHLDSMNLVHKQIKECLSALTKLIAGCKHKDILKNDLKEIIEYATKLRDRADSLIARGATEGATRGLVDDMIGIIMEVKKCLEKASLVSAEAERLSQEIAAKKKEEAAKAVPPPTTTSAATTVPSSATTQATTGVLNVHVSDESRKQYEEVLTKLKEVSNYFKELKESKDQRVKKIRFGLHKAVNTPVNAVSDLSGSHLKDKLNKLVRLLSGQMVEVSSQRISAIAHPGGVMFCKDLLAKKLVKQGDEQVSSNHESAFVYAALTVAIMCEFPDMRDLILAYFYETCPYLIPYYIPKEESQSSEDYFKTLGYQHDSDGTAEKQDKFLRRMSGYTRLFASIIITQPIQGTQHAHPLGVDAGWNFVSNMLSLEPQPDITATVLFDFLQVAGSTMLQMYGKQFHKLLHILYQDFFPKIEAVKGQGGGGPVMRLRNFLEECLKKNHIPAPKGLLPPHFWRT